MIIHNAKKMLKIDTIKSPTELEAFPTAALKLRQEIRQKQTECTHWEAMEFMAIVKEIRTRTELLFAANRDEHEPMVQASSTRRLQAILRGLQDLVDEEETLCAAERRLYKDITEELAIRDSIPKLNSMSLVERFNEAEKAMEKGDAATIMRYNLYLKEMVERNLLTGNQA